MVGHAPRRCVTDSFYPWTLALVDEKKVKTNSTQKVISGLSQYTAQSSFTISNSRITMICVPGVFTLVLATDAEHPA